MRSWPRIARAGLVAGVATWFWACPEPKEGPPQEIPATNAAPVDPTVPLERVNLYFPGPAGKLVSVAFDVPQGPPELRITKLVEGLIQGPGADSGLFEVLPPTTAVGGVLILDNVAYIDLRSADGGPPPAVGSADERLILYSLIDSIVLSGAGADRVVFLWNGAQRETFAGHFDTTRPLGADTELIAQP